MNNQLEKLQLDLVSYREAADKIFSSALTSPTDWQQCFREILISRDSSILTTCLS